MGPTKGKPTASTSKPPAASATPATQHAQLDLKKFKDDFLKAHNEHRKKHNSPPLTYNEKLSKYAEEWAQSLAAKNEMKHRDQKDYGENIYFGSSTDPKWVPAGNEPVDQWYAEIKDFKFGEDPKSTGVGHFTQVVWDDTKEVGVGVAKKKEGQAFIVVANYTPKGNILGQFATKVHPLAK